MLRRDHAAAQPLSRAAAGKREIHGSKRGDLSKRVVLVAKRDELRCRKRRVGELWLDIPEPNNLFGMIKGQRLQQHPVYDAEDGSVCADAEREREDRDGGKSGILCQTAHAVADILREAFQPAENIHVARPFFLQSEISKTFL